MALTKILESDLAAELQQLLEDLRNARGVFPSLTDRLNGAFVQIENLDPSIQSIVQDLQNAKATTGKDVSTRLTNLETQVSSLQQSTGTVGPKTVGEQQLTDALLAEIHAAAERGNYNEQFTYDSYGNVTSVTVTGDFSYTITYTYSDPANGVLQQSVKTFQENGKTVTITKTYTYDATNTNITGVRTTTTIQ